MVFLSTLKRRWRALTKKDELEQELDEELRFHLEKDTARNLESGMNAAEARYAALRTFGGFEQSKEECRDAWGVRFIQDLLQDLRFSVRMLLKSPAFAFLAVLTLTLGIGANTAIFSLLDAVVLRSLPVKDPQELLLLGKADIGGLTDSFPDDSWDLFSYPFYEELKQRNEVFQNVGGLLSMIWNVHGRVGAGSDVQKIQVQLVSGSYFPVLGISPALGRLLTDEDDKTVGDHPVAVISHAWWQRELAGEETAVGKSITIEKITYTIVGVAPKRFAGTTVGEAPDVWIPLAMEKELPPAHWNGRNQRLAQDLYLIGRLKSGVTPERAGANVNLLFKQFLQEEIGAQPSAERLQNLQKARIELTPAGRGLVGIRREFSKPLQVLMGVVGVVLLISCANIANLLLARATSRQKEFGVRLALGAGRIRLIRQLLTESLLIAGLGAIGGILLSWWGSRMLLLMASSGAESLPLDVNPNGRILLFTLGCSLVSAIIFGTVPALRATRIDLNSGLKEGKGTVQTTSQSLLAKSFVVAQVALSLLLMVAAGLFVRTLANLQSIPTGFNQQNVTLFRIDTATTGYKREQFSPLMQDVEEKVKNVPGVQAAAFSFLIFNQGGWNSPIFTRDETPMKGDATVVRQNTVGQDYFTAMGIPVVAGRVFNRQDTTKSQPVAVVSETMAQRFFPNSEAVGRRFGTDEKEKNKIEIVGVVKDVKYYSLTENPKPMVYYPHSQDSGALQNLAVRFSGRPESVVPQIRQVICSVNTNLPVDEVVTLADHIERSLVQQKLVARLASFFGLLALLLACIGLYGVLSYSVSQRSGEIGVRMALGATTGDVLKLILKGGMTLVLLGVVFGIAGSFALTRLAKALLFGVKPSDPLTFAAVAVILIVVAIIACYIPARRATKVDPLTALRYE